MILLAKAISNDGFPEENSGNSRQKNDNVV